MKIKHIGHSCFLIEEDGIKILTDPFITNNPKLKINALDFKPDIILLTHDHADHLGDTIDISKNCGAIVIAVYDLAQELSKYKVSTLGGNLGGTIEHKGIKFTFVNALHSCKIGIPVGFIIKFKTRTLYFAGDTNVFMDMKIIKDLYKPEIVFLPIDGYFNMGQREACYAIKLLEPEIIIPMHYGTFPALKGTPEKLKEEMMINNLEAKLVVFELNEEKEI